MGSYDQAMAWAIGLTVSGGLLELLGIALVALDIRGDRVKAEQYLAAAEATRPLGFRPPGPMKPEYQMMRQFEQSHGPVEKRVEAIRSELSRDLERTTQAAERAAYSQRKAFLDLVRDLLQGGLGRRKAGASLFASGVVLNVAGNVLSMA